MIQENIKIEYEKICKDYIDPYFRSKNILLRESYLGYNEDQDIYLSGWDGYNKSIVFPLKFRNGMFSIVDSNNNPLHIHEYVEENDEVMSNAGLYEIDSELKIPNYRILTTELLWEDYSVYYGIIKEYKISGLWV